MQTPPTQEIKLSEFQMRELQNYAILHGITTDEAAKRLVELQLKKRHEHISRVPGIVIAFPRATK